QTGIFY
ncbi:hypothetical protein VCHC41B1_3317B, partial [Vibrio cholerae HC-41B1]